MNGNDYNTHSNFRLNDVDKILFDDAGETAGGYIFSVGNFEPFGKALDETEVTDCNLK